MPTENDQDQALEMTVAQLKAHVDERFDAVDARFAAVDQRFDALDNRLAEEQAQTRRHFDTVAEQLRSDLKLFADGYQSNYERLDDHERRIRALEKRRH